MHEAALDAFRTRWCHPPLDPSAVRSRIEHVAGPDAPLFRVVAASPAVRLFRATGAQRKGAGGKLVDDTVSAYLHDLDDVPELVAHLRRMVIVHALETLVMWSRPPKESN